MSEAYRNNIKQTSNFFVQFDVEAGFCHGVVQKVISESVQDKNNCIVLTTSKLTIRLIYVFLLFFFIWTVWKKLSTLFNALITRLYLKSIQYCLTIFSVYRWNVCRRYVCRRNVRSILSAKRLPTKCPVGEMSVGEIAVRRNFCWRNVYRRNVCRRNVCRQNVRSAKCLLAKCLAAKSLSAKCPSTLVNTMRHEPCWVFVNDAKLKFD